LVSGSDDFVIFAGHFGGHLKFVDDVITFSGWNVAGHHWSLPPKFGPNRSNGSRDIAISVFGGHFWRPS